LEETHTYHVGRCAAWVHNTGYDKFCKVVLAKFQELVGGKTPVPAAEALTLSLKAAKADAKTAAEAAGFAAKANQLLDEQVGKGTIKQADANIIRQELGTGIAPKSGLGSAKRLSPDELATGQRLEAKLGKSLTESPHTGAEYIDDLGKTYDALGVPRASQFWNESKFLKSIDGHLLKSNNFTVIDLTGFTPSQIAAVERHLATLTPEQLARIMRIGF